MKMIGDNEVKFIDFRFTDTIGKEQHVSVPAHTINALVLTSFSTSINSSVYYLYIFIISMTTFSLHQLSIKSLTKIYANNFYALKAIDLSVEEGDFFALLGDKASMEIPAPWAGVVTEINIALGDKIKQGDVLLALPMSAALSIKSLTKIYANNFYALKAIDLSVEEGDFFALLGSNGAGKTTAIGIICGLLNKTQGDIQILGLNQNTHTNDIKRLIGLMPQEFNFNPFEPIEEILINQAGYYGISRADAKVQTEILLKKMQLWDKRADIAKSLSGGMKRRLMLARALVT
jgi:ABC-type Na+ transport system ATPase subunit NatA